MGDIKIFVEEENGSTTELLAPTEMGLSLMEFLKGHEYPILATCGGMALCATCHVSVIEGFDKLNSISDDEYAILDTLPNITETSRLSCQLKLNEDMQGLKVKICGEG
ncbi:MAG: 2Fe-2S iron-sulfur cluster-binding protein [Bacteroidota bacterium]|jgi:ferredoxin